MSIPTVDIRVKLSRLRRILVGALLVCAVSIGSGSARAEIPQKLMDALQADSPKVRIVAVSGVAKTKDPKARFVLESMLKDPDAAVRAAVVEALGRVADPASLSALEALSSDSDPTVQKVLLRVLPPLRALVVYVYLGKVEDFSGGLGADAAQKLLVQTKAALAQKLGGAYVIHDDATKKGYGASPLAIRSIQKRTEGNVTFVDVKCELTLVEMPGNLLRAALSSTASAGVEGKVSARLEKELVIDGVNACAPELAGDMANYLKERAGRK